MEPECIPISTLPGSTALFRDYSDPAGSIHRDLLRQWYPTDPFSIDWAAHVPQLSAGHRGRLADLLAEQGRTFGAGPAAFANIERLREGAAAVVSGQQVGLFGGPLLTLLKAATAVRKAQDATAATGRPHVPVFWLAGEDHDVDEVDQVWLLGRQGPEQQRAELGIVGMAAPVGSLLTSGQVEPALAWAEEMLSYAPVCEILRSAYTDQVGYTATLAGGFAQLLSHLFADHGLIVMDAASRAFHSLGASTLRTAIEQAMALEQALLARSKELETAGYHAQVKVAAEMSLLFLITQIRGVAVRQALRRSADGGWRAGQQSYSTADLLSILEAEPERLSPNALLRPVFQDTILPTVAYVGGPAEIAYFAQSAVVYEQVLGRVTPILPRLSATLIEPAIAKTMAAQEVSLAQVMEAKSAENLALRLGARAMPVEGKRKIAAAGTAMDAELAALTEYMTAISAELGRAAGVSASKMRYQMNRLRRMAAKFELQKQASLGKQAKAIMDALYPNGQLQERLLGGVWFVARYGKALPALLVDQAGQACPGHRVLFL